MIRVILKYTLKVETHQDIEMPVGAQVLTVQGQNDEAVMWCLVDTGVPLVTRKFSVFTTGDSFNASQCKYIGTFQTDGDSFAGHVFEVLQYQ